MAGGGGVNVGVLTVAGGWEAQAKAASSSTRALAAKMREFFRSES